MNYQNKAPGEYVLDTRYGRRVISFLSPACFRFFDPEAPKSPCVEGITPIPHGVTIKTLENEIIFSYENLQVSISDTLDIKATYLGKEVLACRPYQEHSAQLHLELAEKEGHASNDNAFAGGGFEVDNARPVYGLGERTGPLDKRGYDYINWNTDDPSAHVDTFKSLYQSIPFFILFDGDSSLGIFADNTAKTHFDFNKSDREKVRVSYVSGKDDIYFIFGSLADICAEFSGLVGRSPLVPYWALGAQQCRWSYPNADKVDEVIAEYQEKDLPLSVVYLDIDYMDDYKDFTVDAFKFPDLQAWLAAKKEQGIHIVPIIDAGVKAKEGYFLYDEGIANGYFCTQNGEVYHNEVWPGDSVFPAFCKEEVQAWWAVHIAKMLDIGFAGIWNDMNEPASFKGPLPLDVDMGGTLHDKAHNVYGHYMVKAGAKGFRLAKKRNFQLTRAGYAGTARFSGTWAGDNQSIYDHLRLSLPQLMNMSLSGQAYIGVDIGGFGGDSTPELLAKWSVASLLSPLYRNHSAIGTLDQEPYTLTGKYFETYRNALKLRYALRPTLYTELYLAEKEGNVPLRPLIYNYPNDSRLINENTEVMYGADLLLAPSLTPGETRRAVYFPDDFIGIEDGRLYPKGDHLIDVSLGRIPLFVRAKGLVALEDNESTLRLFWGGDRNATCLLYEDEGDGLAYLSGVYNLCRISVADGRPHIEYLHHGYHSRYQKIILSGPSALYECPFPMQE